MRRLWTEDVVDHHGKRFQIEGARVLPKPTQEKLDVWLGGISPLELKRVGRLGDGWLPSFVSPADVKDGIAEIKRIAAEHDRGIDEDHYGVLLSYHDGNLDERLVKSLKARRPDLDIPPEVERIVLRAMRKRPEERCGSAAQMLAALDEAAATIYAATSDTPTSRPLFLVLSS